MEAGLDTYNTACKFYEDAIKHERLGGDTESFLLDPGLIIKPKVVIDMDNGERKSFKAFRCQHLRIDGKTRGGTRWDKIVSEFEMMAFAMSMTAKCVLFDLGSGGGKGGICCNPASLSVAEQQDLIKRYIYELRNNIGPHIDCLGPDMGTDSRIMGWAYDAYEQETEGVLRMFAKAVCTGKPLNLGGIEGREDATGRGGMLITLWFLNKLGINKQGASVIVQGFGNASYHYARLMREQGAKIIGASDRSGAYYSPIGFCPEMLLKLKRQFGSIFAAVENTPHLKLNGELLNENEKEKILEMPCVILAPGASEGMLTERNANRLRCRFVGELANFPTTPEADLIMHQKGIVVGPCELVSGGGVTVSSLEYQKNITGDDRFEWPVERVRAKLEQRAKFAFDLFWKKYQADRVHPRLAVYSLVAKRVEAFVQGRGLYPGRNIYKPKNS